MGLFLGDSEPSKIFVGDTSISKVFLGDTQVRPSGGGGRLPSEYQEVEWIGSSGTQRIDTGYIPNNNTKAEWKMGNWTETGSHCIFGIMYGFWSNPGRGFSIVTDAYMFNNSAGVTHGMNDGGVHTGELSQAGLFVDGVLKTTPATSTFTCPNNLLLFCTSQRGNPAEYSTFRYYYYKLYDDGTLVRDFVPCYRIADGEIGMYDLVNDVFYTNVGSGTFTKGPNVGPGGGWQPGANTIAYYPLDSINTLNDLSGNNRVLTKYGTATFGTYAGVDCVYVNEGELSYQESDMVVSSSPRTVSGWYYQYQVTSADNATIFGFGSNNMAGWSGQIAYGNTRPGTPGIYIYQNSVYGPYAPFNNGEWYHLCYTYNGTTAGTLYVNGVSALTTTTSSVASSAIGVSRYADLHRSINGYVSELIFEDKERTAQEISDYYNQTKANYGIS